MTTRPTVMTTATGCPIGHMKHSLTAGATGPVLIQDHVLLEKVMHFDREKTPPRNVHALVRIMNVKFVNHVIGNGCPRSFYRQQLQYQEIHLC